MHVLLVEDHEDTARATARLLEMNGCTVRAVGSVGEALAEGAARPFDLLVTDVRLSDGDGLQLLPELRRRVDGALCGIVVSGNAGDAEPALRAGYKAHVLKPVEWGQLLATIQSIGRQSALPTG
jgi:CheY-like chemotaxis protein